MATAFGLVSYLFGTFKLLTPDAPIIHLSNGKIQGSTDISRGGDQYFKYLGIPYAKAPINELRFEPPHPITEKWKGIKNARNYASPCIQLDSMIYGSIIGDENCLYLNVFSPKIEGKFPVLVVFHSGGFTSGDLSTDYGSKYLMDENIVVVTCNFRLYVFGFLNTGDELVRGNMALKDQNECLRWVSENISKLGGDNSKVTIMGSGSGGISVHLHMLSPLSRGLFSKAISLSGNAAFPSAFVRDSLGQAKKYGRRVNCPTRNTSALVRCLKKKKARELVQVAYDLMSPIHTHDEFFTATIETIKRDDTFLSESPFDLMESGNFYKVPWITGVAQAEGAFKVSRLLAYPEIQENVGRKWKEYAPIFAHFDPNRTEEVSYKLRDYYFGGSKFLNPGYDLENLTQLISDGNYFHPTHYAATRHARHSPTFLYFNAHETSRFPNICSAYRAVRHDDWMPAEFKVVGAVLGDMAKNFFAKFIRDYQDWMGVCVDQEKPLIWNSDTISEIWKTSPDYPFSRNLIQTIVNFMEMEPGGKLKFNGLPWPPIGSKGPPLMYMKLDQPPRLIDEPFAKYIPFWDSLSIRNGYDMGNW